jgi:hypothetical protein
MPNPATPRQPFQSIANLSSTDLKSRSARRKLKDYQDSESFKKVFASSKWQAYMLCDIPQLSHGNNTVQHGPVATIHLDGSISVVRLRFDETETPNHANHVDGSCYIMEPPTPLDVLGLVTSNISELPTSVTIE